jgi:hypothetical protein
MKYKNHLIQKHNLQSQITYYTVQGDLLCQTFETQDLAIKTLNNKIKDKWIQLLRRCIKEEGRVHSKLIFQELLSVMPKHLKNDLVEAYKETFGVPPSDQ